MDTQTPASPAPRVTAVLADDERLMRDQLRARLAEVWPELEIVAEAKNGLEAVQLVDEHRPDIVFLDIRMPGLTGVDAARQIAQLGPRTTVALPDGENADPDVVVDADEEPLLPEIVFITAYDQYAVEAFEQGVVDYVLKPAERERLQVTVQRLQQRLAARRNGEEPASPAAPLQQLLHQLSAKLNPGKAASYLQWIQATVGQTIQMIPVDDVLFFVSDEKYTRVQTAQVEALIRKPIKELVDEHRPDIVFLDIRMPGLTGVDAARQIAQLGPRTGALSNGPSNGERDAESDGDGDGEEPLLPEIVFITAYDQYAVEAFEQGVVDYVLKPAERERLQVTVQRLQQRLAARRNGEEPASPAAPLQQLLHQLSAKLNPGKAASYLQWIQATVGQTIQMIPVEDVLFFVSDEKYTRVQTAQVEALIRKPIKELVDELDPQLFWQIHRSTLVAVKSIAGVTRDFRGRQIVSVKGHNEKLEVSRSYTGLFKGM